MIDEDAPYVLADADEMRRRVALLQLPHVQPLVQYLAAMKGELGGAFEMPYFDPLDGGVEARVLFLLEAPGPKAVKSTFISRNNPDPTARNLCQFLADADITRQDTLLWNVVPWYVSTGQQIRPVMKAEIIRAMSYTRRLIGLLPRLAVIVLVGQKAQLAHPEIEAVTKLPIFHMHHPSARVFNVWPERRQDVRAVLAEVAQLLANRST